MVAGRAVRPGLQLQKVHQHLPQIAAHGVEFGQPHILDLLDDMVPVHVVQRRHGRPGATGRIGVPTRPGCHGRRGRPASDQDSETSGPVPETRRRARGKRYTIRRPTTGPIPRSGRSSRCRTPIRRAPGSVPECLPDPADSRRLRSPAGAHWPDRARSSAAAGRCASPACAW